MSLSELLAIADNDIAINRDNLAKGVLKAIADNPMLFNAVSGLNQGTAISQVAVVKPSKVNNGVISW